MKLKILFDLKTEVKLSLVMLVLILPRSLFSSCLAEVKVV